MSKKAIIRQIINFVAKAQEFANKIDIANILQPGLVKEMIVADILGHELITTKRDSDACDPFNSEIKYEYLSCYEGGSGQLDRMFKHPPHNRQESLFRITRNAKIYFAIFYKKDPLRVKVIYEIEPNVMLIERERQLDRSRNGISHVGFNEKWALSNSVVVYTPINSAISM